jgi:hypothetical protein
MQNGEMRSRGSQRCAHLRLRRREAAVNRRSTPAAAVQSGQPATSAAHVGAGHRRRVAEPGHGGARGLTASLYRGAGTSPGHARLGQMTGSGAASGWLPGRASPGPRWALTGLARVGGWAGAERVRAGRAHGLGPKE